MRAGVRLSSARVQGGVELLDVEVARAVGVKLAEDVLDVVGGRVGGARGSGRGRRDARASARRSVLEPSHLEDAPSKLCEVEDAVAVVVVAPEHLRGLRSRGDESDGVERTPQLVRVDAARAVAVVRGEDAPHAVLLVGQPRRRRRRCGRDASRPPRVRLGGAELMEGHGRSAGRRGAHGR